MSKRLTGAYEVSAVAIVPVGNRRTIGLAPTDTNEATMFTAGEGGADVVGLYIANVNAGAANATVKWGNGSTDYYLVPTSSIAAKTLLDKSEIFIPLVAGGTIKVTAGTANDVTFTLVVVESVGRRQG